MKKQQAKTPSLEELIDKLADDPTEVEPPKKLSVKDAILALRQKVGTKVFTKRELQPIIEAAFPQLAPAKKANLDASLGRVKEHLEIVQKGEQNVYRFKQQT